MHIDEGVWLAYISLEKKKCKCLQSGEFIDEVIVMDWRLFLHAGGIALCR